MPTSGKPAADAANTAAAPTGWMGRVLRVAGFLRRHWIVTLLVISLLGHGLGYWYVRAFLTPPEPTSAEMSLGEFVFTAPQGTAGIRTARFNLHVELLDPFDQLTRRQLTLHHWKVRQGVEELLRDLRSSEFEDTQLHELKRMLLAQISHTIEPRQVAGVLVTDLTLDYGESKRRTADTVADHGAAR
jgi:hypothetical protein